MAKQLNIDLNVRANTGDAKSQFQSLQKSLLDVTTSITKINNTNINTASLKQASAAAQELTRHLQNAVNIDTGKLDLNKLNTSLKQSNTDIGQLSNKLLLAGKTGEQAFVKLAQSIAAANRPMITLGTHLGGFVTALKNTARWQISSTILHGFIGAIQSAYGYAQDLNKSLNNIRIVTGYNTEQMAEFAEQANKAAKALNTTTTDYTNAALIYYQQGLRGKEVTERADVTIKLANVSRQSAEEVSNQMTAIWNNFYDGSESLEHYADVITALGAATASSSQEISTGLEKFAAVAETVGLSYEYATSALATITATTRQSADVVGTALKTLFARIQDLELGETLEDGTTLGKYSKALEVVGVNIKDINGEVKNMDTILDELGTKWNTISKDQQIALAQTVAGTRQYAQLMALMSNWDFMKENLEVAKQSEGTLQEQADTFAQSWEAASKKVKASLQSIYHDLLDDKFFISLSQGFSKLLDGLHNFIQGLGGLKPLLIGIGSFFLSRVAGKIQPALQNLRISLTTLFQTPRQQAEAYANIMNKIIMQAKNSTLVAFDKMSPSSQVGLQYAEQLAVAKNKLMVLDKQLTQEEKQVSEQSLNLIAAYYEETQAIADKVTAEQENIDTLMDNLNAESAINELQRERKIVLQELINTQRAARDAYLADRNNETRVAYEEATTALEQYKQHTEELASDQELLVRALANAYEQFLKEQNGLEATGKASISLGNVLDGLAPKLNKIGSSNTGFTQMQSQIAELEDDLTQLGIGNIPKVKKAFEQCYKAGSKKDVQIAINNLIKILNRTKIEGQDLAKILNNMGEGKSVRAMQQAYKELQTDTEKLKQQQEQLNAAFAAFNPTHIVTGIERITATASLMGQVAMMATSLRSIFQAWSNDDLSFGEKLTTTLMSLSMIIPGVLSAYKSLTTVLQSVSLAESIYIKRLAAEKLTTEEAAAVRAALNTLRKKDMGTMTAEEVLKAKSVAIETLLTAAIEKEEIAKRGLNMATIAEAAAKNMSNGMSRTEAIQAALVAAGVDKETAAKWAAKFATDALNASTKAAMGVFGLILIAITAIVTALMAWANAAKKAAEEQRKLRQEESTQALQNAKALEEEQKAIEKLYLEYVNLKLHVGESTDAKEALREKTKELCKALGVEWDALDQLQDKYDQVNEAMLTTRKEVLLTEVIPQLIKDRDIAEDYVEDVVDQNATLSEYDFGMSTRLRSGSSTETYEIPYLNAGGSTNAGNANLNIKNLFYDWMYDNYSDMLSEPRLAETATNYGYRGSTMYFQEGTSQNEIVGIIREFASELITHADEWGVDDKASAYTWFRSFYNDSQIKEQYDAINQTDEAIIDAIKEVAQIEASLSKQDIDSINSIEEFNEYKTDWINNFKTLLEQSGIDISKYTDEYFNDLAEEYLSQFENINKIVETNNLNESLKSRLSGKNTEQQITAFLNSLTDEDYTILRLHPEIVSDNSTVYSLRNTLNDLQALADNEKIQTKIEVIAAAKDSVKKVMTQEDYDAIEKSGINWGSAKEDIIDFSTFIQLTYDQQQEYLDRLTQKYQINIVKNLKTAREALQSERDNLLYQLEHETDAASQIQLLQDINALDKQLKNNETELLEQSQILNLNLQELLGSAETVSDLDNKWQQFVQDSNGIIDITNLDSYRNALIGLATEYNNCTEEIAHYQKALAAGNETEIIAAEAALKASLVINEQAEAVGLDAEYVDNYADYLQQLAASEEQADIGNKKLSRDLISNTNGAKQISLQIQRLNVGIKDLSDNWDEWSDLLQHSTRGSEEYFKAATNTKKALGNLLNVSEDFLSIDFVDSLAKTSEGMNLMQQAAAGDGDAIDALREQALRDIVLHLELDNSELTGEQIWERLQQIQSMLDVNALEVGTSIDLSGLDAGEEEFINALNQLILEAGMSAEQVNAMLSGMGFTANFASEPQDTIIQHPAQYDTVRTLSNLSYTDDGQGGKILTGYQIHDEQIKTADAWPEHVKMDAASLQTSEPGTTVVPKINSLTRMAPGGAGNTPPKSSGKGGGGGSSTKAASHTHEVHRYSNEENTTQGLTETYSRLNDAKDKAFGAERLRLMDRELSTLYKLKDAAEAYLAAVVGEENVDKLMDAVYSGKNIGNLVASGSLGGYLTADYNSLFFGKDASGKNLEYNIKDAAGNELLTSEEYSLAAFNALFAAQLKQLGLDELAIGLDAYGNIRDKDDLLYTLDELHNATEDLYVAGEIDENEYNKRNAYIESIKERMEQYGETVETAMDKVNENLDRIYEIQEKNAEKIAHELEVANELTENTLKQIQNTVKLLGNTIYRDVSAMKLWFDRNITDRQAAQSGRAALAKSTMENIYSRYQLWKDNPLDTNGLTAEQARDLLGQTEDMLQTAFDDIFDQISEMESLFGDTLDYWKDRIEKVTAAMEANAGTLDHLQNVLSLLGKATDYKALGKVLEGQLEVAKQNYEAAKLRANTSSSEYNSALEYYNKLSGEDAEFYKTSVLDKLQEQMQEDTANMQAALENVLEKVNSWFENEVNRIYQESEDRLVGKWGSFDALDAAMQRQHNLADEYLTKTNQLYETNDLLRKLSQDIDKTDSQIAKAKLKAFSDEIEAMKEQNQLSKTDLDIAKARYELLLAQIALEEAQNAKSTVRLQRDNEGNYGYVYTADQDKVAAAEENFAKAQNDLYNLVLGQTQDYTEKIIQTTQERNAALQELDQQWLNGEITDYDEYLTLRQDIVDKYNGLLEAAYASYYTAVKWLNEVGAEGQTEAWTNSFTDILYAQADYAEALTEETANVTAEIDEQMSWLNDQREEYTDEAKVGNDELKQSVDDITTANEELLGTLKGPDGLVNQMHKAAEKADELTRQFAGQYTAVKNLAGEYANLIKQIGGYYQEIADHEGSTMNGEPEPNADKVGGGGSTGGEDTGANEQTTSSGSGGSYARVAEVYNLINNGSVPSGSGRKAALMAKGFSATEIEAGQRAINLVYVNGYSLQKAINQALDEYAGQFDTGGYTGEWGKEGRLAFLHEKELVLNKDDTKNFLDAVSIIREINSAINLRAAASSLSAGLNSPTYGNVAQQVEQTVTIHAEFPNAKDHNEIEEAFNNLINRASQYANRQ